jgi:zinc protease
VIGRGGVVGLRVRRYAPLLVVLLCVALAAVGAQVSGGQGSIAATTPRVALPMETYVLPNGLQVILSRDPHVSTVSTNIWYHVGAANEEPGQTGFAHLFEHMMFQGSGHIPHGKLDQLIEGTGAIYNASTSFDRTNYVIGNLPADRLELALWAESDRMGFLLDALTATTLYNQQEVVRNERRQNREQRPYALSDEESWHQLFPEDHPYHAAVMGSHADIQAATLDRVRAFFHRYYVPNNASLVIAGNFDPDHAKAWVSKYFGPIPRGPEAAAPNIAIPHISAEKDVTLTDKVDLQRVEMAWLTPPAFAPGDASGDVVAQLLAGSESGLLYRDLVRDRKIAQSVSASQFSLAHPSIFSITAVAKPGHTAAEVESAIDADLAALQTAGPSDADLTRARTTQVAAAVRAMEPIGDFDGRADTINRYVFYTGRPDYLQADIDRHAAVSTADVQAFVTDQLRTDGRVVVTTLPGPRVLPPDPPAPPAPPVAPLAASTTELWRDSVPDPTPAPPVELPGVQRFVLGNGLPVYLVHLDGLPLVTASMVTRYGSAADPVAEPGMAQFAVNMLRQGAGDRDAAAIAATVDELGGKLTSAAHPDSSAVTLQTLTDQAGSGLDLLSDMVRRPTFADDAIGRVRDDLKVQLTADSAKPATAAYGLMRRQVFGTAHPYGHLATGTADGLAAIDQAELQRFAGAAWTPTTSALVLAGDLTEATAQGLAQRTFGSWQAGAPVPPVPGPGTPSPDHVVVKDVPGATQTALEIGQPGMARTDPMYEAALVGNKVLGSLGLSSRLDLNLRQNHGWTYGLFSTLAATRGAGWFDISGSVETAHTGESIQEITKEVQRIRDEPVTADELRRGKDAIIGGMPALFQTSAKAAETAADLFALGLPEDFYAGLSDRVEAVTVDGVSAALGHLLDPSEWRIVAVGDRAAITDQLASATGATPVVVDAQPDHR